MIEYIKLKSSKESFEGIKSTKACSWKQDKSFFAFSTALSVITRYTVSIDCHTVQAKAITSEEMVRCTASTIAWVSVTIQTSWNSEGTINTCVVYMVEKLGAFFTFRALVNTFLCLRYLWVGNCFNTEGCIHIKVSNACAFGTVR